MSKIYDIKPSGGFEDIVGNKVKNQLFSFVEKKIKLTHQAVLRNFMENFVKKSSVKFVPIKN